MKFEPISIGRLVFSCSHGGEREKTLLPSEIPLLASYNSRATCSSSSVKSRCLSGNLRNRNDQALEFRILFTLLISSIEKITTKTHVGFIFSPSRVVWIIGLFDMLHPWMVGTVIVKSTSGMQSPEDCGPNQVFQNNQCLDIIEETSKVSINFETDKHWYQDGDWIKISGKITGFDKIVPIAVFILSPDGNMIDLDQVEMSKDGSFYSQFRAGGPVWEYVGNYEISVGYGLHKESITIGYLG